MVLGSRFWYHGVKYRLRPDHELSAGVQINNRNGETDAKDGRRYRKAVMVDT